MEKHAVNKISDIVNMMYSVQGTSSRGGGGSPWYFVTCSTTTWPVDLQQFCA